MFILLFIKKKDSEEEYEAESSRARTTKPAASKKEQEKAGFWSGAIVSISIVLIGAGLYYWWKNSNENKSVRISQTTSITKPSPFGSSPGQINSPPVPGEIPKDADPEVVEKAQIKFKDYPFLFAVAIRESGLRQYETGLDGKPDHSRLLHAHLDSGRGNAIGVMQIIPSMHGDFCKSHGAIIETIDGNLDCSILIHDNTDQGGPDAWDPEDGGIVEFYAKADNNFSKPLRIPKVARYAINWTSQVDELIKVVGKDEPIQHSVGLDPNDPEKSNRFDEIGNIVESISFRAAKSPVVSAHVVYSYRPRK